VPAEEFHSKQRPETTSTVDSRVRRTQSSTAVYRQGQSNDFTLQNGSTVGPYRLGSTYDEGDYDSADTIRPGAVTTSSLQRQSHQTSSSLTDTPPQQQQQQLTGIVREHRRTNSSVLTDVKRSTPSANAHTNGSVIRKVRVETEQTYDPENWNQQAEFKSREIQQQSMMRRQGNSGNVMVVTNVGYEPTTLQHPAPQTIVQTTPVVKNSVSTVPRLNGDSGRHQSSARYDQTSAVLRQQVQSPAYATVHKVQQTTGPSSSVFQRAVIVDASELMPQQQQQQQQTEKQMDLLEQQMRQQHQQHELLLKQQEEERQKSQQRLMTQQQQILRQSDVQTDQRQRQDQLQSQVIMHQRQNVVTSPPRSIPERLPINQVREDDGQSKYKSSTMTTTTSMFEKTGSGTRGTDNGSSLSYDLPSSHPVQAVDRRQSPGNFSTNSNLSGSVLQSGGVGMVSGDSYSTRRADLAGGGGRGDVTDMVVRRGGGVDATSSTSSASSSWRGPAKQQLRLSTASSSGATEQSSVELGKDSAASSSEGERRS